MSKTILQIIEAAKAKQPLESNDCYNAIVALSSMLHRSRMNIEVIASHIGDEMNTHTAARCMLGNLNAVRQERADWMNADPKIWLLINNTEHTEK